MKSHLPGPVILIASTAIFLFFAQPLKAQLSEKYEEYGEHFYRQMRYGMFKPANYNPENPHPLVVYLHGSTDTVSWDLAWYQAAFQKENPCFVLTPKTTEANLGWGHTWNDSHTEAMAKTLALVDSLVELYNINTNRLYIYGISMGAFGVFSVLAKNPGKFAAAYAVCGGSSVKAADKIMLTPLWIFHGEKDDIVPVHHSRDLYKEIVRLGGKKTKYTEYPGVKHNSWENVAQEKALSTWLFSHKTGN